MTRVLRYLAPNLMTLSSMIFGLVSLRSASTGNYSLAAWMIIYAVLSDRLDGLVARALKATSELGMQLDSFADFLNFGVAPAFLVLTYLSGRTDLPFHENGTPHTLMLVACGGYMLCAVFRLARYNILTDDNVATKMFFGFPTTLCGGLLAIWFLVMLKYDATDPVASDFGGARLFGDNFHTPLAMWKYLPIAVAVGGYLMASRLPMPKVGMTKNKIVFALLMVCLVTGYICGFAMHYPEICFMMPTGWAVMFLIWGQASAKARAMYPPPLFPKRVDEDKRDLVRPQADLVDLALDESKDAGAPARPTPVPTAAAPATSTSTEKP